MGEAAFAVGGRLIATDADGTWSRVDDSARLVAEALGLSTDPHSLADRSRAAAHRAPAGGGRRRLHHRDAARHAGRGAGADRRFPRTITPAALTFSGGVAEYIFGHEAGDYGDIARPLATELARELGRRTELTLTDPGQRIRATVIGASQFTVQVSGKTIYLPDPDVLPVHNVPVVHIGLDLHDDVDVAAMADAIRAGIARMDLEPGSPHGDRVFLARRPGIHAAQGGRRAPSCRRSRPRTAASCWC